MMDTTEDGRAGRARPRVRALFDRPAASDDDWVRPFGRLLLGGGRASVCRRARGRALELAVGTG